MSNPSEPEREPANLRFLRLLVTTLMVVMIVGLLVIVALFVIRFSGDGPKSSQLPALPDTITLPNGATAQAITIGETWYGVVTQSGQFLIFDRTSGKLRQTVEID